MKSVFKILLIWFITLAFTSCVKELIPENNGYKPEAVIWAILSPDSNIQIISSGNRGMNVSDVVNIDGIDFFLYEDSVKVSTLFSQTIKSEPQTHTFNYKPKPGKFYILRLFNQKYDISSSLRMISRITKPDTIELSKGENAILKYTITDEELKEDAYQFDVNIIHIGELIDTSNNHTITSGFVYSKKYDRYDEPSLIYDLPILEPITKEEFTFPVNDNLFDGKKKTFLFGLSNPVTKSIFVPRSPTTDVSVSDKLNCTKRYVVIKCRKISPDYYLFYNSENKNNGIFGTPYFNPTNVYSNIKGGLGLMAAFSERSDTVMVFK